jgi:hypothetical protein
MRMRQAEVVWTKQIKVTIYAPEDMTAGDVRRLARVVADDGLRGWNEPAWSTLVGVVRDVELVKLGEVVVSDARDDLVPAEDATWWVTP